MATTITSVDYKSIPGKANQMRADGQALNKELTTAYTSIQNMSADWYGKRYNTLVESFNKMTIMLNEMLKLVVSEIPDVLNTVASNYARVDGDSISAGGKTTPKNIINIRKSNAVGMKFIENKVEATKSNVERNFQKAIDSMNKIESTYKSINWKSDAATAFEKHFKTLKQKITTSFEDIKKQFTTLMNQTISDMTSTEKANTVT